MKLTAENKKAIKAKAEELNLSVTFPSHRTIKASRYRDAHKVEYDNGTIKIIASGFGKKDFNDSILKMLLVVPNLKIVWVDSYEKESCPIKRMVQYKIWSKPALKDSYSKGDSFYTSDQEYHHVKKIKYIVETNSFLFLINKGITDNDEPEVYTQEGFKEFLNS